MITVTLCYVRTSTCQSNIVYAYVRNCQGTYVGLGLNSTICRNFVVSEMTYTVSSGTLNSSIPYHCRNFEFYQNDTKIRRKLAYEMYSCVQLLGGGASPPRPPDQGLCPWTPLGAQPPDPHYRLALPRSP